ncbi:MAG: hypothetical protein LH474_07800 [Chamaesiphon sp.]|nr:hypothetical protein [Chamaesiphon sp.]
MTIAISPDGKILASGGETIKLWDLATGELKNTLQGHAGAVYSVKFSADGKTIASSGVDKSIKLWDLDTGKLSRSLESHTTLVPSVDFDRNSTGLASASLDGTVKLWNIR